MRTIAILAAVLATGCFGRGRSGRAADTAIIFAAAILIETALSGDDLPPHPICDADDPHPPHTCPAVVPNAPPPPDPR